MAKTIPQLLELTSLKGSDLVPVDDTIQSYKMTAENLADGLRKLPPAIITPRTSDYSPTVAQAFAVIPLDSSGGSFNVQLPDPATMAGMYFRFKDVGGVTETFPVTLLRNGSEEIEGEAASFELAVNRGSWVLFTDGVDWWILSAQDKIVQSLEELSARVERNRKFIAFTSVRNWTARAAAEANQWVSVCWSPELGIFCAVSFNGTNRVMTSPNGATWTARAAAAANQWTSVCWSPELGIFCAVSLDGTNPVMTSPDGTTWTARSVPANSWRSVCWSPELGIFVAISDAGTSRVMVSSDGINWILQSAAEANQWKSVCWSPEHRLFVAVSLDGTNRVMTSPDGTTWTARAAAEANQWVSVCWSPELGIFCAVSLDGTNRVMTSPDGTTWTAHAATEANLWQSVCWSPELGIFCAVSSNGTNRTMRSL